MKKTENLYIVEKNRAAISTIFLSFEDLEKKLGNLNLDKSLFMTFEAKREFARTVFEAIKKQENIIN